MKPTESGAATSDRPLIPPEELLEPVVGGAGQRGTAPCAGIARAAALAPEIDLRNGVTYALLSCKSVLSRCESDRVPFQWSVNPYRGCEFGCAYCYARYTHEYMEIEGWEAFERRIFVKENAALLLAQELRRKPRPGEGIAIGTATDPYQPAERRHGVTRSLLEVISRMEGLRVSITTKSDLVLRDRELLRSIGRCNRISVNITVTTLDGRLARILEPRAARPDLRLHAARELASDGLRVNLFLMPVMPWLNDTPDDLEAVVRAAAQAGAAGLGTQVLFLRASARQRFFPWLAEHFPRLLPRYQRLYGGPPGPYKTYCAETYEGVRKLKERYGLTGREPVDTHEPIGPQGVLALE